MIKTRFITVCIISLAWLGCKNKSVQELGKGPSDSDRTTLYTESLKANQSDSLFFDDASPQNGQSKQDVAGVVNYFKVDSVLASMLELPTTSSLQQTLSVWSGISPWENTETDGVAFKHINPLFIAWCVNNAIPDPSTKLQGSTCKELYDKHYSRTVKLYLDTYNHLENNDLWQEEVILYRELTKSESFHPTRYFDDRFRGVFDALEYPHSRAVFNPSNGISFWMRREMDGSRKACYKALKLIEERYN